MHKSNTFDGKQIKDRSNKSIGQKVAMQIVVGDKEIANHQSKNRGFKQ